MTRVERISFDDLLWGNMFCEDADINTLHSDILQFFSNKDADVRKAEYSVWSHVTEYGYRFSLCIGVLKADMEQVNDFIYEETEKMEKCGVKLTVSVTPYYGSAGKDYSLYFYTYFADKKRRKHGKPC